jgi:hypothetical protein
MGPNVSFHLTHEEFDHFAERLLARDIIVRETWRSAEENLERGRKESEIYTGFLNFRGIEFSYNRRKSFSEGEEVVPGIPRRNPNLRVFTTYFDVTIIDHEPEEVGQLFVQLEYAFPQPEDWTSSPLPPVLPRPWTPARILSKLGCLLLFAGFLGVCYVLILGVRVLLGRL